MEAPQGGFSLSKVDYSKPPLSIDDQLELLISRGLEVGDREAAKHFLVNVGYYRLSGFSRYYAAPDDPKSERLRPGISFQHLIELYEFDRRIRALLSRALERIEVAVKSKLSHEGAIAHGAFWLCEPTSFDRGSHHFIMELMDEYIGDRDRAHQHIFINHFVATYSNPYPPCWMMMELFSFGTISKIYKHSKGSIRQSVSSSFGLQHDVFESWLHSLAFARNVCAHHNRVWNRKFTIKPKVPKMYAAHWPASSHDRLYTICSMIWHLLSHIDRSSPWADRLAHILDHKPNVPLTSMGFPDDWRDRRPWSKPTIAASPAKPDQPASAAPQPSGSRASS